MRVSFVLLGLVLSGVFLAGCVGSSGGPSDMYDTTQQITQSGDPTWCQSVPTTTSPCGQPGNGEYCVQGGPVDCLQKNAFQINATLCGGFQDASLTDACYYYVQKNAYGANIQLLNASGFYCDKISNATWQKDCLAHLAAYRNPPAPYVPPVPSGTRNPGNACVRSDLQAPDRPPSANWGAQDVPPLSTQIVGLQTAEYQAQWKAGCDKIPANRTADKIRCEKILCYAIDNFTARADCQAGVCARYLDYPPARDLCLAFVNCTQSGVRNTMNDCIFREAAARVENMTVCNAFNNTVEKTACRVGMEYECWQVSGLPSCLVGTAPDECTFFRGSSLPPVVKDAGCMALKSVAEKAACIQRSCATLDKEYYQGTCRQDAFDNVLDTCWQTSNATQRTDCLEQVAFETKSVQTCISIQDPAARSRCADRIPKAG